jgi:hypothetical protein
MKVIAGEAQNGMANPKLSATMISPSIKIEYIAPFLR